MCVVLPLSVNECNLRKVYTIAPREVRKTGNDDVREKPSERKQSTGCDALSIDLIHSGSSRHAHNM
jgi:hypothetical protein